MPLFAEKCGTGILVTTALQVKNSTCRAAAILPLTASYHGA
jgi:hypothetical protein